MDKTFFDLIILGSGPAGLAAAQYGARANLSVLVIENGATGGQVLNIMGLENYPGVFPAVSGADFITTMIEQAKSFGAEFINTTVHSIDKIGRKFVLQTESGELNSYTIIVATGAEHRKLGIPGESTFTGSGVSYCATCDGAFFKNKKIVVVGGGDSACDEALFLSRFSNDITILHRKSSFRAQKAVADRVLNNPKITVSFNTVVKEIKGKSKVESLLVTDLLTGLDREILADGVFIYVGMEPRTALIEMLPKDKNGYVVTNEKLETAVKGMYCAGDIRSKLFRQIVTATSDGALAAFSASIYISELKDEAYI